MKNAVHKLVGDNFALKESIMVQRRNFKILQNLRNDKEKELKFVNKEKSNILQRFHILREETEKITCKYNAEIKMKSNYLKELNAKSIELRKKSREHDREISQLQEKNLKELNAKSFELRKQAKEYSRKISQLQEKNTSLAEKVLYEKSYSVEMEKKLSEYYVTIERKRGEEKIKFTNVLEQNEQLKKLLKTKSNELETARKSRAQMEQQFFQSKEKVSKLEAKFHGENKIMENIIKSIEVSKSYCEKVSGEQMRHKLDKLELSSNLASLGNQLTEILNVQALIKGRGALNDKDERGNIALSVEENELCKREQKTESSCHRHCEGEEIISCCKEIKIDQATEINHQSINHQSINHHRGETDSCCSSSGKSDGGIQTGYCYIEKHDCNGKDCKSDSKLKGQIRHLQNKLTTMKSKNENLMKKNKEFVINNEQCIRGKSELNECKQKCEDLKQEKELLLYKISSLKNELRKSKQQINQSVPLFCAEKTDDVSEKEFKRLKSENLRLIRSNRELIGERKKLEKEKNQLKKKVASSEMELEKQEDVTQKISNKDEVTGYHEAIKEDHDKQENHVSCYKVLETLEKEKLQLQKDVQESGNEICSLQEECKSLKRQLKDSVPLIKLKEKGEELKKITQKNNELERTIKLSEAANSTLRDKCSGLKENDSTAALEAKEKQIELERLTGTNFELKKASEELSVENRALKEKCEALENEVKALAISNKGKERHSGLDCLIKENTQLQKNVAHTDEENRKLEEKCETLEGKLKKSTSNDVIKAKDKELKKLTEENSNFNINAEKMNCEIRKLEAECKNLEEKLKDLTTTNLKEKEDDQKLIEQLREENERLKEYSSKIEQENYDLRETIDELEEKEEDLLVGMNTLMRNQTNPATFEDLQVAKEENMKLNNYVSEADEKIQALQEKCKMLEEQIRDFESSQTLVKGNSLGGDKSRNNDDKDRINEIEKDNRDLEIKLEEIKETLQKEIDAKNEKQQLVTKKETEIKKLQNEKKDLLLEISKMNMELKATINELNFLKIKDQESMVKEKDCQDNDVNIAGLKKEMREKEGRILELEEEVATLKDEINEECAENSQMTTALEEQLKMKETEIEELKERFEILEEENSVKTKRLMKLQDVSGMLTEIEKREKELDMKWKVASEERDQFRTASNDFRIKCEQQEMKLERMLNSNAALEKEKNQLETMLERSKGHVERLEKKFELWDKKDRERERILEQTVHSLEDENKSFEEKIDRLENEKATLRESLRMMMDDVER